MKASAIDQGTTTVQTSSQLEAAPVEAEQETAEFPQPATPEEMKPLQRNATEKKAGTLMNGQLLRLQLEKSIGFKTSSESIDSEIRERLSYSLSNLMITKSDVDAVQARLQYLSPRQFRGTMEGMHGTGLLKQFINHLDTDSSKTFLQKAVDSGYIQREPAPAAAVGKFDPPVVPGLLRNDRQLPIEVREAIHEDNLNNAHGYYKSYEQYIGRYSAAVLQAKSGEEIRAIGAPVERKNLAEPGVSKSQAEVDYSRFSKEWYGTLGGFPTESRGYEAISDRMHDLTGAKRAGSVWLTTEFQVGLEKKLSDVTVQPNVTARWEVSNYGGNVLSTDVSVQATDKRSKFQLSRGVQKTVTTAPGGIRTESEQKSSSNGLQFKRAAFSVDDDGTVEGSYSLPGAPHGFAKFNPNDGSMEIGVGHSVDSGLATSQIRLGIGIQGSSPERARDAAAGDVGTFGTPPELEQGMNWNALPEERRGYFERSLGWNETEWNKRLAAQQK